MKRQKEETTRTAQERHRTEKIEKPREKEKGERREEREERERGGERERKKKKRVLEGSHWVNLWLNLKMDCAAGELVLVQRLERVMRNYGDRNRSVGEAPKGVHTKAGKSVVKYVQRHDVPRRRETFSE